MPERFTVRMTNNGLNKLAQGDSAEEGDVEFAVPAATQSAVLQVRHSDESTRIPVELTAKW